MCHERVEQVSGEVITRHFLQGIQQRAEVLDIAAEEQVAEMREGEEHDGEHDQKANQILDEIERTK